MAKTTYIVQSAAANMPSSCRGTYRRVAVLEISPDDLPESETRPRMISAHARGVVRVVETWERCNVGSTSRCAYERAWTEAEEMAAELNAEIGGAI